MVEKWKICQTLTSSAVKRSPNPGITKDRHYYTPPTANTVSLILAEFSTGSRMVIHSLKILNEIGNNAKTGKSVCLFMIHPNFKNHEYLRTNVGTEHFSF